MKKIITYWTFDILHKGHVNILKKAKEYWDYLVVWVTGDEYDQTRGKLNVVDSLDTRIGNVKKLWIADEIIVESRDWQKISDIQHHNIDCFVIGSDWEWKFDYLSEFCEVIYLPRTPNISSTILRENKRIVKLGIIWSWRIANRFMSESKYVSALHVSSVLSRNMNSAIEFKERHWLDVGTDNREQFLLNCDAVYIATPHETHYEYIKYALENGKHVLCEKPSVLKSGQMHEIIEFAKKNGLVFLEWIKTLYSPGFLRLLEVAKSWSIGTIIDIDASFTKLVEMKDSREFTWDYRGSFYKLWSYPIAAIIKILGKPNHTSFFSYNEWGTDLYTKIMMQYNDKFAIWNIWLWVKREWEMVIAWTKGYIYVHAPWWLTQEFEVKYEDQNKRQKYFIPFQWDWLRYEIAEFIKMINNKQIESWKYTYDEMIATSEIMALYKHNYD